MSALIHNFTLSYLFYDKYKIHVIIILAYTPVEPVISPFKPINRLLKIDRYNGTTSSTLPLDYT